MLAVLIFVLIGSFSLTAVNNSFRYLRQHRAKSELEQIGKLFFYRQFHLLFFPHKEFDSLYIATLCAKHLLLFSFAAASTAFIFTNTSLSFTTDIQGHLSWLSGWLGLLIFAILSMFFGDFIPRAIAAHYPTTILKILAPIASIFLIICFPLTFLILKLPSMFTRAIVGDSHIKGSGREPAQKIIELLEDREIRASFDANDRKLIESVLTFKDRVVREVMMPRVNVFSLPAEMTVREAARVLIDEGYSRVPVYKETVDQIIGVLMYKDILRMYMQYDNKQLSSSQLDAPLETLIKPVFYTPETKKVSQLLQDFRNKQMHMAIVVDEYGGTEGIVTIEDILEEIVGDIADEYDDQEEALFIAQPSGGWIVDARMSILDIEENFDIAIPQDADYDTIGGYIYHRAGTIPKKGFRIQHDDFEIEVLNSNERAIDKVRIIPRKAPRSSQNNTKATPNQDEDL
jgi:CBS domain containing-hemolysin-like protein